MAPHFFPPSLDLGLVFTRSTVSSQGLSLNLLPISINLKLLVVALRNRDNQESGKCLEETLRLHSQLLALRVSLPYRPFCLLLLSSSVRCRVPCRCPLPARDAQGCRGLSQQLEPPAGRGLRCRAQLRPAAPAAPATPAAPRPSPRSPHPSRRPEGTAPLWAGGNTVCRFLSRSGAATNCPARVGAKPLRAPRRAAAAGPRPQGRSSGSAQPRARPSPDTAAGERPSPDTAQTARQSDPAPAPALPQGAGAGCPRRGRGAPPGPAAAPAPGAAASGWERNLLNAVRVNGLVDASDGRRQHCTWQRMREARCRWHAEAAERHRCWCRECAQLARTPQQCLFSPPQLIHALENRLDP